MQYLGRRFLMNQPHDRFNPYIDSHQGEVVPPIFRETLFANFPVNTASDSASPGFRETLRADFNCNGM
ncbi:MAG: hypothetical protein WCJ40_19040 [Planctomycetota bacterium]|nr:hypothetical protein [Planctomycetota bacterium]